MGPRPAAYRTALEALPSLDLDDEDRRLAEKLLKTLFLWHLARLEVPQPMSSTDLVEDTLTSSDLVKNVDLIELVLDQISVLPQIEFKDSNASFVVAGVGVEPFPVKFERFKRKVTNPHEMRRAWRESLFLSPTVTGGERSLLGQYEQDKLKPLRATRRCIEYPGELVVGTRWRAEYGQPLQADDRHFRVVILTRVEDVAPSDLHDPRIAILMPGSLTNDAYEAARDYLAAQQMTEAYQRRLGNEAEEVRQELQGRVRTEVIRNLLATHQRVYRAGHIATQNDLGIDAADVFSQPNNDRRLEYVVDRLLTSAYPQLPVSYGRLRRDFRANDASKVFDGFFSPRPRKADESALDNYAVGLGLALTESPKRFAPTGTGALGLIWEMLGDADGGELATWQIHERLSGPPYGLPYALISLYLLCFVRHSQDPVVNLHLKSGHRLRLRSGDAPPRNVLGRGNVVQLAWKPRLQRWFDLLAPTPDVWPQVVPFGRALRDDLVVGMDAGDVEQQQARLSEALADLRGRVQQTQRQVRLLCAAFGSTLADEDQEALNRVESVSQTHTYQELYDCLSEAYSQPEALGEDMITVGRLGRLAEATRWRCIAYSQTYPWATISLPMQVLGI